MANLKQIMSDYFEDHGGVPPSDTTLVSWLPFYHDMGLMLGIFTPVSVRTSRQCLTSPIAFLQKPARWMQLLASNTQPFSPAPNFAYELTARRTSDADMAGLDLGNVLYLISGAERVHAATVRRFTERFSRFNLPDTALRPSYGLAEATVYVTTSNPRAPRADHPFRLREAVGRPREALWRRTDAVSELVSHGAPRAVHRAHRRSRDVHRESGRQGRGDLGARRQRRGRLLAKPASCRSRPSVDSSSIHRRARRRGRGCGPGIWASCPTASCSSSAVSRIC